MKIMKALKQKALTAMKAMKARKVRKALKATEAMKPWIETYPVTGIRWRTAFASLFANVFFGSSACVTVSISILAYV